jgi:hypothetical protein
MASLQGKRLQAFMPDPHYLLIFNMGDDTGVFTRKKIVFNGKTAYLIKDYIDGKFMKQFKKFEQ